MFLVRNVHYFRFDDFASRATLFTRCKNLSMFLVIYVQWKFTRETDIYS